MGRIITLTTEHTDTLWHLVIEATHSMWSNLMEMLLNTLLELFYRLRSIHIKFFHKLIPHTVMIFIFGEYGGTACGGMADFISMQQSSTSVGWCIVIMEHENKQNLTK